MTERREWEGSRRGGRDSEEGQNAEKSEKDGGRCVGRRGKEPQEETGGRSGDHRKLGDFPGRKPSRPRTGRGAGPQMEGRKAGAPSTLPSRQQILQRPEWVSPPGSFFSEEPLPPRWWGPSSPAVRLVVLQMKARV